MWLGLNWEHTALTQNDLVASCETAWHSLGPSVQDVLPLPWCLQDTTNTIHTTHKLCLAESHKALSSPNLLSCGVPKASRWVFSSQRSNRARCPKRLVLLSGQCAAWNWPRQPWWKLAEVLEMCRALTWSLICGGALLFWGLVPESLHSSWLFLLNSWLWIRPYIHIFNLELFGILNSTIMFLILLLGTGEIISAELCQKMH